MESSEKPSNHADQTQSGIFVCGCVRAVLGMVAVADETVDAVRWPHQQHTVNGAKAIAPGHVAVAFALKSTMGKMLGLHKAERKIFPLMLLQWSHHTQVASIVHMSGI